MNEVSTSTMSSLIEKQGTGIEKQGTGIEKQGTGIEKSGTGIRRGLRLGLASAICLFTAVAWTGALASSPSASIAIDDGQFELSVKLSSEQVGGQSVLDSGYGMVTLVNGSGTGALTNGDSDPVNGSGTGASTDGETDPVNGSGTGASTDGDSDPVNGSGTGASTDGDSDPVNGSGTGSSTDGDSDPVNGSGTGSSTNGETDPVNGSGTGVAGSGDPIASDFWGVAEVAVDDDVAYVVVYQLTSEGLVEHSTYSMNLTR